jgi:transcriptional regulator with GAF, ATPase, and Fis domain
MRLMAITTETMEPDFVTLRINRIRVAVLDGPDAGQKVESTGPELKVGTGKACHLVLTDRGVSQEHLIIRVEGKALRVSDLGSKNGTKIDGVRVIDAYARLDSKIEIGRSTLQLRMLPDLTKVRLSASDRFGELLGRSVAMRRVFALLEHAAASDVTVLIEGETGTGKDLAARGIHAASARSKGPYVVLDCSAVPETLIESELFGHVRGAFTGASQDRIGCFEEADGGTLFLDEIGEMPLSLQPKLLRALDSREVRKVGGRGMRRVDVRVIAATNRSLAVEVENKRFRGDLFHRLAVIRVAMPPLRERAEDIPYLVRHFEQEHASHYEVAERLPDDILSQFRSRTWEGNVRELKHNVEVALVVGVEDWSSESYQDESMPPPPQALVGSEPDAAVIEVNLDVRLPVGRAVIEEMYERAYLAKVLEATGWNVVKAASIAGVGRAFIHQRIKKYGLIREPRR